MPVEGKRTQAADRHFEVREAKKKKTTHADMQMEVKDEYHMLRSCGFFCHGSFIPYHVVALFASKQKGQANLE